MSASHRILVVDDNADVLHSTAMLLSADGHEVHVANNGVEALAIAERKAPRVVLLDIGLPGIEGVEVAYLLRKLPNMRDALILAVSGRDGEEDVSRSLAAGCQHHLSKPLDFQRLYRLLN